MYNAYAPNRVKVWFKYYHSDLFCFQQQVKIIPIKNKVEIQRKANINIAIPWLLKQIAISKTVVWIISGAENKKKKGEIDITIILRWGGGYDVWRDQHYRRRGYPLLPRCLSSGPVAPAY